MWARPDLRAELKGLGLLRSPDLDHAFLHVRQESFLPESLSLLAYADMPLPVHISTNPPTMPSPRCLVAAIDLLEPEAGLRVLIAGCRGGYPVALLAEIVGPEHVVVVETDAERRTRSARRLEAAGFGAVRVLPSIPDETFDRILVLDATPPKQLVRLLADPGSLIGRGRGVHDLAFVKLVRRSGETAQMTFNEAPSGGAEGPSENGESGPVDFGRLFAVEDLLAHAWEGRVTGHYDQHFRDLVDETFSKAAGSKGPCENVSSTRRSRKDPWIPRPSTPTENRRSRPPAGRSRRPTSCRARGNSNGPRMPTSGRSASSRPPRPTPSTDGR